MQITAQFVCVFSNIQDTQQLLQAFQTQSPTSKQDLLLQERVALQVLGRKCCKHLLTSLLFTLHCRMSHYSLYQQLPQHCDSIHLSHHLLCNCLPLQLRAARYEVYDIFFSLSARERMQLISWDRELARERELRRQVTFSEALVKLKQSYTWCSPSKQVKQLYIITIKRKRLVQQDVTVSETKHYTV